MKHLRDRRGEARGTGFVLLEIMVAIALFGVVATSMVVALQKMVETSALARKESIVFRRTESVMAEFLYRPGLQLTPGQVLFPADATGVSVEVLVNAETLFSGNGSELTGMYRVRFTGRLEGATGFERYLERIVYSPRDRLQNR